MLRLMACLTLIANGAAIVGYRVRLASFVAGLGFYAFASFNGIHLQTLALVTVWANLIAFAAVGTSGGSPRVLSASDTGDPVLLRAFLVTNLLIALFFSGIEKALAGWPRSHELCVLFSYPAGSFVRDWVTNANVFRSETVCGGLGYATLLVEIGCPILLLSGRLTLIALVAYEAFFLFVLLALSIPPVFYITFAGGGLLFVRPGDGEHAPAP